jgi:MerR family transcriptional regulator/heat shock protein HspR
MRERMEEMNRQMHSFVEYVRTEMLTHIQNAAGPPSKSAMVPLRKTMIVPRVSTKVPVSPRKPQ